MQCPNCKVHSVRKTDTDDGVVLQCHLCSRTFELDDTNHLRPVSAAITHTTAILAPAPVKAETMDKAVVIAEKSLEREVPLKLKTGAIAESYHAEVLRRLSAGDKPGAIARDIGYTPSAVYSFKYKNTKKIRAAQKVKSPAPPAVDPPEPAAEIGPKNDGHKHQQSYNNTRGNIMSMMKRLQRGEIRHQAAGPVLLRYRDMLNEDLKSEQTKIKKIKHKIEATDEALKALDIIRNGEKDIVEKVLAVIK